MKRCLRKRNQRNKRIATVVRKGNFNLRRLELTLQKIFQAVSLDVSIAFSILDTNTYISGDGTCVVSGACGRGRKLCDCAKKGQYHCSCPRRYSDPRITYGWDSSKELYFYGYSDYVLAAYNPMLKLDLPLFLRIVEARRHDSISAIVSLTEFRQLCPKLSVKGFLSDSASDNYETYHLLKEWQYPVFIALNNRAESHFTYKQVPINEDGIPICEGGLSMIYDGRDNQRRRNKFHCPAKCKKKCSCPLNEPCSPSSYGRTVYTKTADNPRFFTTVPRGSRQWNKIMKQRTSVERINK